MDWSFLSKEALIGSTSSYDENFTAKNVCTKNGNPWLSAQSIVSNDPSSFSSSGAQVNYKSAQCLVFKFASCVEVSAIRFHTPSNGWPGAEPSKLQLQVRKRHIYI